MDEALKHPWLCDPQPAICLADPVRGKKECLLPFSRVIVIEQSSAAQKALKISLLFVFEDD